MSPYGSPQSLQIHRRDQSFGRAFTRAVVDASLARDAVRRKRLKQTGREDDGDEEDGAEHGASEHLLIQDDRDEEREDNDRGDLPEQLADTLTEVLREIRIAEHFAVEREAPRNDLGVGVALRVELDLDRHETEADRVNDDGKINEDEAEHEGEDEEPTLAGFPFRERRVPEFRKFEFDVLRCRHFSFRPPLPCSRIGRPVCTGIEPDKVVFAEGVDLSVVSHVHGEDTEVEQEADRIGAVRVGDQHDRARHAVPPSLRR